MTRPGTPPFPHTPIRFTWWVMGLLPVRSASLFAITILGTAIQSSAPYAVGGLIDVVERQDWGAIGGWFAFLVVAWLAGPLIQRLYTILNAVTLPRMRVLIDRELFLHTLGQSTRFFSDSFAGALMQRIRRAGQAAPGLVEMAALPFARVGTGIVVSAVLLATAAWSYALAFLVFAVCFVGVTALMARGVVRRVVATAAARARVTGHMTDTLENADVVRSFAARDREDRTLGPISEHEYRCARDARIALTLMRIVQLLMTIGFMSGLLWVALQTAAAGGTGSGTIAMILTVGVQLGFLITQLGDDILQAFEQMGELKESLDRLGGAHEAPDRPDAPALAIAGGEIRFDHVRFHYADGKRVFDDLDLLIRPGEKVGLVGRSGAGKSTLVKLLTRRYRPISGRVLIDGQDIAEVALESLARAIGEVPQTVGLFHRTIRHNLAYGRPDATPEELFQAARRVEAHDFILGRPRGYDAIVGERGVKLSGGERQRIAVARAFLKDAPILVLDEATSSLDTETERAMQAALWQLMRGRTVIAIAHRLSTVRAMDRIVVLEEGRIVEQGPPEMLIRGSGAFARAWSLQHDAA